MAVQLSNPSIMMKARMRTGETIMIDDFREAYWWLRDNTPEGTYLYCTSHVALRYVTFILNLRSFIM